MQTKLKAMTERLKDLEDQKEFALAEKSKMETDKQAIQAERNAIQKQLEDVNVAAQAKKTEIQ